MRNPMNSWDRSDSMFNCYATHWNWNGDLCILAPEVDKSCIGPKDMKLAQKLVKGGSEHRKFLRQIMIWMDITIPRYVWQELDTYKVATVRNSCSTMHKLGHTDLEPSDFQDGEVLKSTLDQLNEAGRAYRNKTQFVVDYATLEGYDIVRYMKKILPEGFLQKATYSMNYETALTMYKQRKNHRLPEWNAKQPGSICSMIASLPWMREFAPGVFE